MGALVCISNLNVPTVTPRADAPQRHCKARAINYGKACMPNFHTCMYRTCMLRMQHFHQPQRGINIADFSQPHLKGHSMCKMQVQPIVDSVRDQGDAAVSQWTAKFDKVEAGGAVCCPIEVRLFPFPSSSQL